MTPKVDAFRGIIVVVRVRHAMTWTDAERRPVSNNNHLVILPRLAIMGFIDIDLYYHSLSELGFPFNSSKGR